MSSKSKASSGVSLDQAAVIHELLGSCLETSLRQQLVAGEFNAAILGKTLEWLKHNNISVVEEADSHLASLAAAFRAGDQEFNFQDNIHSSEI